MTARAKAGSPDKRGTPQDLEAHKKRDAELDEALEESFPASDPASIVQPPHSKEDKDGV